MSLFETIKYTVLKSLSNKIELRHYPTFYVAGTTTSLDDRYTNGFMNVFNYISGENSNQEKISMTTPVVSTVENNRLTTQFVVPRKYEDKAPLPSNTNVALSSIEEGTFAVITFRGKWTTANFDKHDKQLLDRIQDSPYKVASTRYILRYQPPMIPSVFRRNEIMYRVTKDEETS